MEGSESPMPAIGDVPIDRLFAALYATPLPQGDAACGSPHPLFGHDAELKRDSFAALLCGSLDFVVSGQRVLPAGACRDADA
jgi:hypothetical protein